MYLCAGLGAIDFQKLSSLLTSEEYLRHTTTATPTDSTHLVLNKHHSTISLLHYFSIYNSESSLMSSFWIPSSLVLLWVLTMICIKWGIFNQINRFFYIHIYNNRSLLYEEYRDNIPSFSCKGQPEQLQKNISCNEGIINNASNIYGSMSTSIPTHFSLINRDNELIERSMNI
jgi:hypothetical protein